VKKDVEYIIPYEGLKNGKHEFVFRLGDAFFEKRGEQEFSDAQVTMNVEMIKDTTMLVFSFEHSGSVQISCDRCLETYRQPLEGSNKLIVNFGEERNEDDETVIVFPRSEYEIDLADYIYEYVTLSLPWKRECAQDISRTKTCDEAMIRKIEALRNNDTKAPDDDDPRWDALKKLK
jgi:uncharacterized metal-binding protein YceD (DUF177 family)